MGKIMVGVSVRQLNPCTLDSEEDDPTKEATEPCTRTVYTQLGYFTSIIVVVPK